jgi:hypothetical protein
MDAGKRGILYRTSTTVSQYTIKRETPRIVNALHGVFRMLSNHDQFIPATISSKGSPLWRIMSLAFIWLLLKGVQILRLSQHCDTTDSDFFHHTFCTVHTVHTVCSPFTLVVNPLLTTIAHHIFSSVLAETQYIS